MRQTPRLPSRAIARQLGVAESTVRYHLQRPRDGAVGGRKSKSFVAEAFEPTIDAWRAAAESSPCHRNVVHVGSST